MSGGYSSGLVVACAFAALGGCEWFAPVEPEPSFVKGCQVVPTPGREESCNGADDDCDGQVDEGNLCGFGATCELGQCVVAPEVVGICGDGRRDGSEECDDGNLDPGDDCDAECRFTGICANTCGRANDGVCDDGGLGSETSACAYGTDCGDCSPRRDDPCREFPSEGACLDEASIARCTPSGGTLNAAVMVETCSATEICATNTSTLSATCMPTLGECSPGATRCAGDALLACDDNGLWQQKPCAGACVSFAFGDHCPADAGAPTVSGVVRYEARTANAAMNDWGDTFVVGLSSALLVNYRYNPATDSYQVYDATTTSADGFFDLRVPANPDPNDRVVVWLVGLDDAGKVGIAVANPRFEGGGQRAVADVVTRGDKSELWSYAVPLTELVGSREIMIDEGAHSEMARVFDHMRYVYHSTGEIYGRQADPLVVWMQPEVGWECGACSGRHETKVGEMRFAASIWLSHDDDEGYWSDAVVAHELGHWVMDSFGTSPQEGGRHFLGQPTLPGQAWSEGFATFFSSLARADERYFAKRRGTFFWIDLEEMSYPGRAMVLPTAEAEGHPFADDPLLQRIDENVVAAMSYAIARAQTADQTRQPALEIEGRFFLDALATPRMNVKRNNPQAQFPRRYVRHTWSLDQDHQIVNITPVWSMSVPMFADYLDALRCLGDERGIDMDASVAESILSYPYPIDGAPICN